MACRIIRKKGEIDRVLAPNGEDSILYKTIKDNIDNPENIIKENTYIQNRISDGTIKNESKEEIALGLWSMVYTPEFKSWFGDWENNLENSSKIVDKNGEPLLVYHGGSEDIKEFNASYLGTNAPYAGYISAGFYFTPSIKDASEYGKIYPVYLNIKNPYLSVTEEATDKAIEERRKADIYVPYLMEDRGYDGYVNGYDENSFKQSVFGHYTFNADLQGKYKTGEIIAFKPNQIKSVFNQGTFLRIDDNIYFSADHSTNDKLQQSVKTKIYQFIQKAGFKLEQLEDYNEHLKANNKSFNEGVKALVNFADGVVALSKGATDYDFIEEAAHIAVELHPDNNTLARALELVVETEDYKKNVEGYTKLYKEQNPNLTSEQISLKVKKEILGKLVAKHTLTNNKEGVSSRFFRTLKSLWDRMISLFKQQPVDELSSFVKGISENMLTSNFKALSANISSEDIYASNEEISEAKKSLKTVLETLNRRLKDLKKRKQTTKATQKLEEDIKKLQVQIDKAEENEGLIKFIEFLREDVMEARDYIENVKQKKKSLTSANLINLREFIQHYTPLLHSIKKGINSGRLFNEYSKERRDNLIESLKSYIAAFDDIRDFYEDTAASVTEGTIRQFFKDNNLELDFDIEKAFSEIEKDANIVQVWAQSIRDLGSNVARVIYAMVAKVVQSVNKQATEIGRDLIYTIMNGYNIKDTSIFAEMSNGKATGFFITKYKLGDFYKNHDDFFEELRKEYDLEDGQKEPSDPKKALEFRNKINKYLAENTERKYTKEYYDLMNNLSLETREALMAIDMQKQDIINRIKDEKGNIDYYNLTDENYQKVLDLEIERAQLAKLYESDGTKKVGKALEIAKELQDFNKKKKDKLKYDKNKAKFAEAYNEMQRRLTPEQFEKWVKRNTEESFTQDFWDTIELLASASYPPEIKALYDKRNELLSPYRKANLEVRYDKLPQETIDAIKSIDEQIAALQTQSGGSDPEFFKVAEMGPSIYYAQEAQKARNEGRYDEWYAQNHYKNYKKKMVPYSYWNHMRPKNKYHYDRVKFKDKAGNITEVNAPAKNWSELSKDSEFYNKSFDENWVGIQPKISKWGNSDYNKLTQNERTALEEIMKLKREMDQYLPLGDRNTYMLPQISQSLNDMLSRKDLTLSSFKELFKDKILSRVDDTEFGGENVERLDGTIGMYVPMHYTQMLEDPTTISLDILSSMILYSKMAINFKEMTKIAPDLEIMKEQLGEAKFVKHGTIMKGKDSNVYDMIQTFLEMQVYGKKKDKGGEWQIGNYKINVTKLANNINSYIRANNLMFNVFTILSGYFNGTVNSIIEDLVGRYTTLRSKNLARKEYLLNIASAITEIKAVTKKNKMNVMLEHFKVVAEFDKIFDNLDKDKFLRYTKEDVVYAGYGLADYALKAHLALGVLFNYRFYEGKFYNEADFKKLNVTTSFDELITVYDMYEVQNGKFVPKQEHQNKITEDVENYLEYVIKTVTTKADGVLSDLDRVKIQKSVWGQLVATHRGWLIDGISRRWKAKGVNYMTGDMEAGYHREFWNLFRNTIFSKEIINNMKELFANWDNLESYQKEAILRTLFEMAFVVSLAIVAKIVNGLSDDEDDNYALEFSAYLSNRVLLETAALSLTPTPLPYMEILTVLNSPVAGTKQLETLQDLPDLLNWQEVEKGPYKGYPKAAKTTLKLIPAVKGAFTVRDPESANQFLKNKPLKWLY